ncbi:MAG TPA: site-2 protease family protein [Phycisphaerae bacterium]|nr:site-2 protease family protein [Phycisphaerae bacterium]HUU21457.1 site-2 protease family protein [Phycisphaerae bacterium]
MEILLDYVVTYWTNWVWPIGQFLIGLGLVVFVHEFGHFLAAKWAGIKVLKFSIGMGKPIWSFQRGETQYQIAMVPIGGYVHMMGQDDFKPADSNEPLPGSWQAAPAGKKLIVLAAGVTMNVIFAMLCFVLIYMAGKRFVEPVVGGVVPDFPAATVRLPDEVAKAMGVEEAVGLRPTDRITAINGKKILRFQMLIQAAGLSDKNETFDLSIQRDVDGKTIDFNVSLKPKQAPDGMKQYMFGIAPATVIDKPAEAFYAGQERFATGDVLAGIAGEPIAPGTDLLPYVKLDGTPVKVRVRRDEKFVDVPVKPYLYSLTDDGRKTSDDNLEIFGMAARAQVGEVMPDSPAAKAGLVPGDVVVEYAGITNPSQSRILKANKGLYRKETYIRVLRDGKVLDPVALTPRRKGGRNVIGVGMIPAQDETVVARVVPDSAAAGAGVPAGAVITKVNDTDVSTWQQVYNALAAADGGDVRLTYRADGAEQSADLGVIDRKTFDATNQDQFAIVLPALGLSKAEAVQTPLIRLGPIGALQWGFDDTVNFVASTYKSLLRLIQGRVSPKGASGPVGIGDLAIRVARKGPGEFIYFMSMLSAIIAVFNFLPLPVLDGGHVVMVLIEKIRRKPIPLRVQMGIQITGWVLILGLFAALTYQDIMRWIE